MDTYLISFELNKQSDYSQVSEHISKFPKWARIMENVWIVKSKSKLTDVRDGISSLINKYGGSVFVVKINNSAWGPYSVSKEVTDWMKENI